MPAPPRLRPTSSSSLQLHNIQDARQPLRTLLHLMSRCRGPPGQSHVLHNDIGGHVTATSACGRLLHVLAPQHPVLKLLLSCVQGHLQRYNDGGLLTSTLALSLALSADGLHPHLAGDIYEYLLKTSVSLLTGEDCSCHHDFSREDVHPLRLLATSVLGSKPGCQYWPGELSHITELITASFLLSMSAAQPTTHFLYIEGLPIMDSYMTSGLMFPCADIPASQRKTHGQTPVAVFTVSMAGDSDEGIDATFIVQDHSVLEDRTLDQLLTCARALVDLCVGLVACQKVVHPAVKKYLRSQKVLVLERLGTQGIHRLHSLTGGALLGSFTSPIVHQDLGCVGGVEFVTLEQKPYLHLNQDGTQVCTVVLCNRSEEPLQELKHVCESSQHVLRVASLEHRALVGAGQWQRWLVEQLKIQLCSKKSAWCHELGCTEQQLQVAGKAFCAALLNTIPKSSSSHHEEYEDSLGPQLHASSGAPEISTSSTQSSHNQDSRSSSHDIDGDSFKEHGSLPLDNNVVLDSFSASVNALKIGVGAAVMVLGIHTIIQEK